MSSTNKTSLGLNRWEASDKPVRQDFVNDNLIIDQKLTQIAGDSAWREVTAEFTDLLGDAMDFYVYVNPGARLVWISCNYNASGKTIAADQAIVKLPSKYMYLKYAYGMAGIFNNPNEMKLASQCITNGSTAVSGTSRFRFTMFYPY